MFKRLFSVFKTGDPLKREIMYSINTIERMVRSLEVTRKNLEAVAEEHKKRTKISGGDRELAKILEEETRNIQGYLNLMTKSIYDLTRVKYRLETILYVEEPLRVLPEVLEELRNIEPVIEKINPQLLSQIKSLEQRVAGLLAVSSMASPVPYVPSTIEQKMEQGIQSNEATAIRTSPRTTAEKPQAVKTQKESELARAPPPQAEPAPAIQPTYTLRSDVPLNVVEQWILLELRQTAGVLDLSTFERKYGVSRSLVLEALRSLESKNLVKVKRR